MQQYQRRLPAENPRPNLTTTLEYVLLAELLAEAKGDRNAARDVARRALDLAGSGPVFSLLKTVDAVKTDKRAFKRLDAHSSLGSGLLIRGLLAARNSAEILALRADLPHRPVFCLSRRRRS